MLLIHRTHQCRRRRQDLIDEDEDRFLWCELDSLSDDVDELANGEVLKARERNERSEQRRVGKEAGQTCRIPREAKRKT